MTEPAPLFRKAHLIGHRSEAIRMARILCILSMVTVHFWPGSRRILTGAQPDWAHPLYTLLVDYLGRSSVPLLSLISGALLVISLRREAGPGRILQRKLHSLILPMVAWSAALLALYALYGAATGNWTRLPQGPMGWINALMALTGPPANLPLAFLRDTFVCAVIATLTLHLVQCQRIGPALLLLAAALAVMALLPGLLILRPQIALFYAAGIGLALTGWLNRSLPWAAVLALFLLDIAARNLGGDLLTRDLLDLLNRIAMSLLVWKICETVVRQLPAAFARLRGIEPYVFTLFCSHMLIVTLVAGLARSLGLSETTDSYLAIFLLQYPATLAFAVMIVHLRRSWQQHRARASLRTVP